MRDHVETAAGVRQGDVLAGKYRVERVLGVGGMGVVVAAFHLQLQTRVALKSLLPVMLHRPELVGRFAREARAAAKIASEHLRGATRSSSALVTSQYKARLRSELLFRGPGAKALQARVLDAPQAVRDP